MLTNSCPIAGEYTTYTSKDEGTVSHLCHAPKALHLKKGAPVILNFNITDQLVNGLMGTVEDLQPDVIIVQFPKINKHLRIQRHTFTNYSKQERKNIGTRIQFPLELAFALTVHKAQGLTLDRVCIDCRNMTNSGQIGVSVGRAKAKKGLRIMNFNKYLVRPHPQSVSEYYKGVSAPLKDDCTCCKNADSSSSIGEEEQLKSNDMLLADDQDDEDGPEPVMIYTIKETNVSEKDTTPAELSHTEPFHDIDKDIITDFLSSSMYSTPLTEEQKVFNDCINYLVSHKIELAVFSKNVFSSLKELYHSAIPIDGVAPKDTKLFYKLVGQFLSSDSYKDMV